MEYKYNLILRLLDDLESFKSLIEWEYPLQYQLDIDKAIEIIREVQQYDI